MTPTTQAIAERIPAGTYSIDPVHSSASFEVEHGGVSTFRGGFTEVEATLSASDDGLTLAGSVPVESIDVEFPDLRAHLLTPEFFDAERHPEIRFASQGLSADDDGVALAGELEINGERKPVEARGELRGPAVGLDGFERIALELETVVDRHLFGLDWQADLPKGGKALGDDVTLTVVLEFIKG